MKFWIKIETFLNKIIESILSMLGRGISKSTPENIKKKIDSSRSKIEQTKKNTKDFIANKGEQALANTLDIKNKTLKKADEIQSKSLEIVTKAKEVDYKKVDYKKLIFGLFLFITPVFAKVKSWVGALGPKTIISSTLAITIATLSSISIYTQSKKISEKATASAREPASEVENATAVSKRKGYYKLEEKRFMITNVTMPVYIGTTANLKSLSIDFTFVSSNRYIKTFFDRNRHLIKDRMNSTIQPLIPEFPLEAEGKKIIKEKIQIELNSLIKELDIKGEIDEVHITSILAG
ncbi:hypothetical protein [Halobacteriovorax sp. HLS]|uniref:hypothetical protein n=1 Tax=Halobacteriovorax sp. HLS TaxID=2234000 RepID=UPI000FD874C1|nr:hypothetical protein [Halobacteriovorax sp. HLS]